MEPSRVRLSSETLTMACVRLLSLVLLASTVLCGPREDPRVQAAVLAHTLLGPDLPASAVSGGSRGDGADGPRSPSERAPQFMLDLYEKYKHGWVGGADANTVRSIHAEIGEVKSETMYVFNVSVVSREHVLRGELHVLPNPPTAASGSASDTYTPTHTAVRLFALSGPRRIKALTTLALPKAPGKGLPVTESLRECLGGKRMSQMGVMFGEMLPGGRFSELSMAKTVKAFTRPFLVVFSNASQNISVDHVHFDVASSSQQQQKQQRVMNSYVNPETGKREMFSWPLKQTDSKKGKVHRKKQHKKVQKPRDLYVKASQSRFRRSILDNELPPVEAEENMVESDALNALKGNTIPKTHPTMLQGRDTTELLLPSNKNHAKKSESRSRKLIPYPDEWESGAVGSFIPYPDDYKRDRRRRRRKNRRKNRRNKNNRRRNNRKDNNLLPFPEQQKSWNSQHNAIAAVPEMAPRQPGCGRRSLTVDFADIGWSDWIISPKSFEFNYCAGVCDFPLAESVRPSNHATIQSILEAIGIHPDVPAPCCAPDAMASLTLLFFDHENHNVVLKNYPGMTVTSCACR